MGVCHSSIALFSHWFSGCSLAHYNFTYRFHGVALQVDQGLNSHGFHSVSLVVCGFACPVCMTAWTRMIRLLNILIIDMKALGLLLRV